MRILNKRTVGFAAIFSTLVLSGQTSWAEGMPRTMAPEGASVSIISPQNGDTVATGFDVIFGLSGMGVAPAGTDNPKTGHHHLLIDHEELPEMDQPMGKDVKHFGGGQTQTTLTLDPGVHTLQLIVGDMLHIPHDPAIVSEKITITVR